MLLKRGSTKTGFWLLVRGRPGSSTFGSWETAGDRLQVTGDRLRPAAAVLETSLAVDTLIPPAFLLGSSTEDTAEAPAGAEGGLAFVEQEGGAVLGVVDAAAQVVGGEAGGKGGMGAEEAEELQAAGLAGLDFGGVEGEVGSEVEGGEAVGMEDPEGEEVALVVGAVEIASEEGADIVQLLVEHRFPG